MKNKICLLSFALMFASSVAGATGGSSVGGGTLSNIHMKFSTSLPILFTPTLDANGGDVHMEGPPAPGYGGRDGGMLIRQAIQVFLLPNERPDLATITDRLQMRLLFSSGQNNNMGWSRLHHPNDCVEWFEKEAADSTITDVLVWGNGSGIILTGRATDDDVDGISSMIMRLQLDNGACGWK